MEYDDLIKNVKATLVKAAAEGKKKGIASAVKEAIAVHDRLLDEFKTSFNSEMEKLLKNVEDSSEEDSSKEK